MLITFFNDLRRYFQLITNPPYMYMKQCESDKMLLDYFRSIKTMIHMALCNAIETNSALELMKLLISRTNEYTNTNTITNPVLLQIIAKYVTRLINIFGLNPSTSSTNANDIGLVDESILSEKSETNIEDIDTHHIE